MIRNFGRHIRDAFRNFFRNGWMTLASIVTMTVTLLMVGGLVTIVANTQKFTTDIEKDLTIRVLVDVAANASDEARLEAELKEIAGVKQVDYRTKEEEVNDLIESFGEEFDIFAGDANPLNNVFVVHVAEVDDIPAIGQKIEGLTYVHDVNYGGETADNILKGLNTIRYVIAFVAAVLVVVAVLLVSNTIRTTITARQTEIEIMSLVGATERYIKAPFIYEGMFIGCLGGAIAAALLYVIYQGFQRSAQELFGISNLIFIPSWPFLAYVGGALVLVGIILGNLGARRSLRYSLNLNYKLS